MCQWSPPMHPEPIVCVRGLNVAQSIVVRSERSQSYDERSQWITDWSHVNVQTRTTIGRTSIVHSDKNERTFGRRLNPLSIYWSESSEEKKIIKLRHCENLAACIHSLAKLAKQLVTLICIEPANSLYIVVHWFFVWLSFIFLKNIGKILDSVVHLSW